LALPPINPSAGQAGGPARPGTDVARQGRTEAQRAFFQAALGRAQAPAATTQRPTQMPVPHVTQVQATPEPAPADRIPRPGSIINIIV
jgi:hypothetical protein